MIWELHTASITKKKYGYTLQSKGERRQIATTIQHRVKERWRHWGDEQRKEKTYRSIPCPQQATNFASQRNPSPNHAAWDLSPRSMKSNRNTKSKRYRKSENSVRGWNYRLDQYSQASPTSTQTYIKKRKIELQKHLAAKTATLYQSITQGTIIGRQLKADFKNHQLAGKSTFTYIQHHWQISIYFQFTQAEEKKYWIQQISLEQKSRPLQTCQIWWSNKKIK